ncbi:MAG: hypothetical protein IPJ58_08695 [Ardenticatenia bacterium]|nr:hypothetical protein [Ardenticatenia bacterium]
MTQLDQERIQAIFSQLGLGSETDRRRFQSLAKLVPMGAEFYTPIRLDIGSSAAPQEEEHAKLASTAGRDQSQG